MIAKCCGSCLAYVGNRTGQDKLLNDGVCLKCGINTFEHMLCSKYDERNGREFRELPIKSGD